VLGTDIILGSHSFPVIGMSKDAELKIKIMISKYIYKIEKIVKKLINKKTPKNKKFENFKKAYLIVTLHLLVLK